MLTGTYCTLFFCNDPATTGIYTYYRPLSLLDAPPISSIAPTGTTSLLAGNVSSGIEPVFAYSYVRRVRQADGSRREEPVEEIGRANVRTPDTNAHFVSRLLLEQKKHEKSKYLCYNNETKKNSTKEHAD